jgi:hypothetical protein
VKLNVARCHTIDDMRKLSAALSRPVPWSSMRASGTTEPRSRSPASCC